MRALKKHLNPFPEKGHLPSIIPYVGGKAQLVSRIVPLLEYGIQHFAITDYIEPCGGSAKMLLNLPYSRLQRRVYNDIDKRMASLFYCFSEPDLLYRLIDRLDRLGVSEEVFLEALSRREHNEPGSEGYDILDAAADTFIVCRLSRAAKMTTYNRTCDKAAYRRRVHALPQFLPTLKGVEVRADDIFILLAEEPDLVNTLWYIDPPYVAATMTTTDHYGVNWSDNEHERLVAALLGLKNAKVVLSGYDNALYAPLTAHGWNKLFLKRVHVSSSTIGRYQDEYIWFNFDVPSALIEQISDLKLV